MKIYVIVSDQYRHLIEPNSKLIDKYWPNQDVHYLCYTVPKCNINYPITSLGNQENYAAWSDALIEYFTNSDEKYFTIILDDFMLVSTVDNSKVDLAIYEIENGADKVVLYAWINETSKPYSDDLVILNQDIAYRATLHPAIWTKDYFIKCAKPNMSPWKFELSNISMNDGAKILAFKIKTPDGLAKDNRGDHVFNFCNLYVKYKLRMDLLEKIIPPEDQDMVKSYL